MAHAWMPGARRFPSTVSTAVPRGGAPRAVWTTTESDPGAVSATAAAQHLQHRAHPTHLVWNPRSGEVVQALPATAATRGALVWADELDRGRDGRLCLLIAVVGFASLPFTEGPTRRLADIVSWLDSWGVARAWPAGVPERSLARPAHGRANEATWARGGHYGLSQVPGSGTAGPGPVCPEVILGLADRPHPSPLGSASGMDAPRHGAVPLVATPPGSPVDPGSGIAAEPAAV